MQSTGFFRGMSGPLLSYGYLSAIFFGCYGWTLKKLNHVEDPQQPPAYAIIATASMVAVVPQVICGCPIDLTKVILQSQIPHKHGKDVVLKPYLRLFDPFFFFFICKGFAVMEFFGSQWKFLSRNGKDFRT